MLNRFSTSMKLYMLIFITAVSLVGLGIYGFIDLKKMNDNTRTLYTDRVLCMQQLANIRFQYLTEIFPAARNVKDHVLTFNEAKKQAEKAQIIIDTTWQNYKRSYLTPEENLLVKQTEAAKSQTDKASENLQSILAKRDIAALNILIQKQLPPQSAPIIIKVTQLMELQTRVGKEILNNNKKIYQRTSKNFFLLILFSLGVALSLSLYIIKNIKDLVKGILRSNNVIKESEGKYRSLLEQASDAIYLSDFKGDFTDVNESMCKITGYSKEELLQLNIKDIIDPEQLKTDPIIRGQDLQEHAMIRERRLVRKDGKIFEVESNVKRIADNLVLVIARDITDRKLMEAGLREAEAKFRTAFEYSAIGIAMVSLKGNWLKVNISLCEILGYSEQELLVMSIFDVTHPDDDSLNLDVINNVLATENGVKQIEKRYLRKNGLEIWASVNIALIRGDDGGPLYFVTQILDITEHKKAELLILKEKELSETIINSLPGVFYLQSQKGEYLLWNKNFETVTGYTKEEIVKLSTADLIAEEDLERVQNTMKSIFADGYATVEAKAKMKDGTKIPFLLTGIPIIYENQFCLLGTGIDISLRIKAEEELRSSEQKYKLLFEHNPVPLWMIARDDLSIIAVNETAANLYGYTKDEILHSSATIVRLEEDIEAQVQRFKIPVKRPTDRGVMRHLKKDGTIMFVNVIVNDIIFEGREVRLVLTNDVTEQLKADELLKKSEANLKTIMNTTDTAYALLDKELNVMAFNQMAVKFVNNQFQHHPVKGDKLGDYFHEERFPQFTTYANKVLEGDNISYEINYPQADGSVFWYYVRLFPITNEKNEIFGLMLALSDITERKNAEESLKSAYISIQNHISSIKDMAWKQSHLIRSPLANLKGLASMLKDDPSDNDVLNFIQVELGRMDTIIIEMAEDASKQEL